MRVAMSGRAHREAEPGARFFASRRRHARCSRDWSSDVCSSDLFLAAPMIALPEEGARLSWVSSATRDRKSVVEGKSVDLGGRRIIKKKKGPQISTDVQGLRRSRASAQGEAHFSV